MDRMGTREIGWANDVRLSSALKAVFGCLLAGLVIALILNWQTTIITVTTAMALASFVFALCRLAACLSPKPAPITEFQPNGQLPPYTVLVPIFREANMVEGLMAALERLEYPRAKLEIFLICEAVDPDTIAEVRRHLRAPFELIIVPKGTPQTKPRALNYALKRAKGDLITIYDAEDRPHPAQLKTAATAFAANPKWSAIQAPLDYFNSGDNWLTRQFTLEYAALFHVWLPALARLGLPFPLGGTSNHMRRCMLEIVGGWDPYNVTEDADLSFRIAAHGGEIGYITPPTDEEAVSELRAWHFQRSRWIKGFMQSWIVHMAAPLAPGGWRGIKRFLTLQFTLGFTILSIWFYAPSLYLMSLFLAYCALAGVQIDIPIYYIWGFGASIGIGVLIGMVGAWRAGKPALLLSAIWMPVYWVMLFAPALRAGWEMGRMPFHWHKTRHGVTAPLKV